VGKSLGQLWIFCAFQKRRELYRGFSDCLTVFLLFFCILQYAYDVVVNKKRHAWVSHHLMSFLPTAKPHEQLLFMTDWLNVFIMTSDKLQMKLQCMIDG